MMRRLSVCVAGLLGATAASADWELDMPRGVTELSVETHQLHWYVFLWCVAIGIVVFGTMIYSLFRHRRSVGARPAQFSHSMTAEIIWTTIPVLILLVMAVPAAETLIKIEDSRNSDLTVVITGYQWKWHYRYQDADVAFYSNLAQTSNDARRKGSGIDPASVENYLREVDNPMVVPVGAKVRVLLTSNDVVHAWWVPELAIKKDAVPGYMNEAWFQAEQTGTYRGQCAELCGMDHGYMPVVVEVVEQDAFDNWINSKRQAAASIAAAGD